MSLLMLYVSYNMYMKIEMKEIQAYIKWCSICTHIFLFNRKATDT